VVKVAKKASIEALVETYYPTANKDNVELTEEYLDNSTQLSSKSVLQYRSALKIFLSYVNLYCNNKHFTELKSLEFLKYQNWLAKQGLYDSAIKLKRTAVNNLNEHIILFHGDEYPTFRNFITRAIKVPETGKPKEKCPLTDEEYSLLCKTLEEREQWQKLAYLKFSYISASRKNEARQLLKEVVDYAPLKKVVKLKDENGVETTHEIYKYKTNFIKCKGRASDKSNTRKLSFDEDTRKVMVQWLQERGEDDCPYMFITKKNGKASQVGEGTFNEWVNYFKPIIGRDNIYPHLIRSSRATSLKDAGKSLESIKQLLGHKSSETTKIYIVQDDEDDEDEVFT
jgi:site-specific recombinase XerD